MDEKDLHDATQYTTADVLDRLTLACDGAFMTGVLQPLIVRLFGVDGQLRDCAVRDARLKLYENPASWKKSSLSVCYYLDLERATPVAPIVYAKTFLRGCATQMHDPFVTRVRVGALDFLLWSFPNDPKLTQLRNLTLPERILAALPTNALASLFGERLNFPQTAAHVVKYVPEKACTIKYEIPEYGARNKITVYAKSYIGDDGVTASERMWRLWHRATSKDGIAALRFPKPLGYDANCRTVWQLGIVGTPLKPALRSSDRAKYVAQLARGLAELHQSKLLAPKTPSIPQRIAECAKKARKVRRVCAELDSWLDVVLCEIRDEGLRLSQRAPAQVTIYGDFHHEQVLIRQEQLFFFDFDSFATGDAEQDLAEFIVALYFACEEIKFVRECAQEFVCDYRRLVPWRVDVNRLYWHALVEYYDRAYRLYLRQEPHWQSSLRERLRDASAVRAICPHLA